MELAAKDKCLVKGYWGNVERVMLQERDLCLAGEQRGTPAPPGPDLGPGFPTSSPRPPAPACSCRRRDCPGPERHECHGRRGGGPHAR